MTEVSCLVDQSQTNQTTSTLSTLPTIGPCSTWCSRKIAIRKCMSPRPQLKALLENATIDGGLGSLLQHLMRGSGNGWPKIVFNTTLIKKVHRALNQQAALALPLDAEIFLLRCCSQTLHDAIDVHRGGWLSAPTRLIRLILADSLLGRVAFNSWNRRSLYVSKSYGQLYCGIGA